MLSDISNTSEVKVMLSNIRISLENNALVIISGRPSSGKTLLCNHICGFYYLREKSNRTIAYVRQAPVLFDDTIKANILSHNTYEQSKYETIIKACCLAEDFSVMADSDLTYVGSKGCAVSTGQRMRIAIASALYSDSDIVIMDDVFNCLDSKVRHQVFENCVLKFLSKKIRIITTSTNDFNSYSTQIINLDNSTSLNNESKSSLSEPDEQIVAVTPKVKKNKARKVKIPEIVRIPSMKNIKDITNTLRQYRGTNIKYIYNNILKEHKIVIIIAIALIIECITTIQSQRMLSLIKKYRYILFILLSASLHYIRNYLTIRVQHKFSNQKHDSLLGSILHAPQDYIKQCSSLSPCFDKDMNKLDYLMFFQINAMAEYVLMSIIHIMMDVFYCPNVIFPIVLYLTAMCYISFKVVPKIKDYDIRRHKIDGSLSKYLSFLWENAPVIKAMGREEQLWSRDTVNYADQKHLLLINKDFLNTFLEMLNKTLKSLLFTAVLFLYNKGYIIESVTLFMVTSFNDVESWLFYIFDLMPSFIESFESCKRIESHILTWITSIMPIPQGAIEFNDVVLSYNESEILSINLKIAAKSIVAIVGRTGSGKTSIAMALKRLCNVKMGKIVIDNYPLFCFDPHKILYIESYVYPATVRENILMDKDASDDQILAIINGCSLKLLWEQSQLTLDTKIVDDSANISNNDKKLINYLRAIVNPKQIVVIDEPVVDWASGNVVNYMLQDLSFCTRIVITHDEKILKHCQ